MVGAGEIGTILRVLVRAELAYQLGLISLVLVLGLIGWTAFRKKA